MERGDGHRRFENMAVAHVLGGLSEAEGRLFRSHLLECADCRARVGELRAIAHELADVERDEQRSRAMKAVETKRRASQEQEDAGAGLRGRRVHVLALVGLVALMALVAWNFVLRSNVADLRTKLDNQQEAVAALQFGEPWQVVQIADGVDATVREHNGGLAVLVEGLNDQRVYGLYLVSEEGRTLASDLLPVSNGQAFPWLEPLDDDIARIVITRPSKEEGFTADPTGFRVLEVRDPSRP